MVQNVVQWGSPTRYKREIQVPTGELEHLVVDFQGYNIGCSRFSSLPDMAGSRVGLRSLSYLFMYAGGDVVGYTKSWAYRSEIRPLQVPALYSELFISITCSQCLLSIVSSSSSVHPHRVSALYRRGLHACTC